jgi:hypothetical protein
MKILLDRMKNRPVEVALATVVVTALTWFSYKGLHWTAFWYDESVQFWISRGLCALSAPGQEPGGVRDVLRQNARDNLDPGGFSLFLHFWLLAGTGMAWQRAAPLLFFLAGVAALGWLGWRWHRKVRFALFSALVPAAYPMLMNYANEVRAYSMEFAGVICGCLVLDLLLEAPRPRRCWIGGVVIGIFLSSRYSYAIFAAALSVVFLLSLASRPAPASARARWALFFFAPLVCVGVVIFLKGFLPQYKLRISYKDGELLGYLTPYMASEMSFSQISQMLRKNLFSLSALPLTVGSMAALLFRRRRADDAAEAASYHLPFYLLPLLTVAATALLWKWHPWNMDTKWSSYLHALSAVMTVRLTADALRAPKMGATWFPITHRLEGAFLAVAIWVLSTITIVHRRPAANDLVPVLTYLECADIEQQQVAVNVHWYPTLRYFYEEGIFEKGSHYPRAFRLPCWPEHGPLIAEETRYLVTYQNLEQLAKSYPGVKFVADLALPSNLYRVEPPKTSLDVSRRSQ